MIYDDCKNTSHDGNSATLTTDWVEDPMKSRTSARFIEPNSLDDILTCGDVESRWARVIRLHRPVPTNRPACWLNRRLGYENQDADWFSPRHVLLSADSRKRSLAKQ
jgi:hypothetical protein